MPFPTRFWSTLAADPRHGQIGTLATLLVYGIGWLGFDLTPDQVALTVGTALAVQAAGDTWKGAPRLSGAKSALISSLSLCLLLRTEHAGVGRSSGRRRGGVEVRDSRARQTRVQSDEPRAGVAAARDHRRVGVARAMGHARDRSPSRWRARACSW